MAVTVAVAAVTEAGVEAAEAGVAVVGPRTEDRQTPSKILRRSKQELHTHIHVMKRRKNSNEVKKKRKDDPTSNKVYEPLQQ